MELTKTSIRMCRQKKKAVSQITMDDDFIVPDIRPDMEKIAADDGAVEIEEVRRLPDKTGLRGKLFYRLLYYPAGGGAVQSMEGEIPFDEYVNMPELADKDYLQAKAELEDLTIEIIHSRKINVKAIITFVLTAEGLEEQQAVTGARDDGVMEVQEKNIRAAQVAVCQKDTYRVKEELELSGSQPDMEELLWRQCRLRNVQTRALDGGISLQGVLDVFCIYRGQEDPMVPRCLEREVGFSGTLEIPDAVEEMYPEISVELLHCQMEIQPDFDGENRSIALDAVLELDIRLYEEGDFSIVSDVYSTSRDLEPEYQTVQTERILVKNSSRTKVTGKVKCETGDNILQICHVDGSVKLDDRQQTGEGMNLEGALCLNLMYMTDSDRYPLQSMKSVVPFQYQVEARGMDNTCICQLNWGLEQLGAVMLGAGEVEIRASVLFDLLARKPEEQQIITGIAEKEPDLDKIQSLPGIVVYVVRPEDTLWKIAKKFHASVESIRQVNGLAQEDPEPGKQLLVIKQI